MYPPPWTKTMTGSGSSLGVSGVTTLSVRQSSLMGWYLPMPETQQGVAALLGCAVGEAVAVPHPRPGLGGQRGPEPQPPHGCLRVRDGSPAVYAVAREAFDGAGGRLRADGALVHNPTVADTADVGRVERRNPERGG